MPGFILGTKERVEELGVKGLASKNLHYSGIKEKINTKDLSNNTISHSNCSDKEKIPEEVTFE